MNILPPNSLNHKNGIVKYKLGKGSPFYFSHQLQMETRIVRRRVIVDEVSISESYSGERIMIDTKIFAVNLDAIFH